VQSPYGAGMHPRRALAAVGAMALLGSVLVPTAVQAEEPMKPVAQPSVRAPIAAYSLVAPRSESPSGLLARVVLAAGVGCPKLIADVATSSGVKRMIKPMTRRTPAVTTLDAFGTLLVCEAAVPRRATSASVAGRSIPAAIHGEIDTIALLGDSGCRIKGSNIQNCNDPEAWPFAKNALSVARERPDVTIFLGDFYYREEACPESANEWCGGSPAPLLKAPFTDSAWGWVADVLVPMAPLLSAAPIVMVRGNHELCERGGNGFFLMFDPAFGSAKNCAPSSDGVVPEVYSPTTAVDLSVKGGRVLRLVNVDSANGDDTGIDAAIAAQQRPLFEQAARLARVADESWLLTHRPIAGMFSTEKLPNPPGAATPWSSITQTYSSYGLLDRFDFTLSSHIHLAQAVQVPGLPGEIVLGNAGTELEPPTGYGIPPFGPLSDAFGNPLAADVAPLPTATYARSWVRFGYAIARPAARGWTVQMKDASGQRFATCGVVDRGVNCR